MREYDKETMRLYYRDHAPTVNALVSRLRSHRLIGWWEAWKMRHPRTPEEIDRTAQRLDEIGNS